jgi:hypothetical protein
MSSSTSWSSTSPGRLMKTGPVGGVSATLGRAVQDPRQVLGARHVDGPLTIGCAIGTSGS